MNCNCAASAQTVHLTLRLSQRLIIHTYAATILQALIKNRHLTSTIHRTVTTQLKVCWLHEYI